MFCSVLAEAMEVVSATLGCGAGAASISAGMVGEFVAGNEAASEGMSSVFVDGCRKASQPDINKPHATNMTAFTFIMSLFSTWQPGNRFVGAARQARREGNWRTRRRPKPGLHIKSQAVALMAAASLLP